MECTALDIHKILSWNTQFNAYAFDVLGVGVRRTYTFEATIEKKLSTYETRYIRL